MKTVNIADVTQEEFDSAVQLVISGIKASDPKLDTRVGTVLRSLLVNPEARIEATTARQIEETRKSTSLKTMLDAEKAGDSVDANDVNAVMSNFNIRSSTGTYADGLVKVTVSSGDQAYTIPEGSEIKTADGLKFIVTSTVTAAVKNSELSVVPNTVLWKGTSSYFFLVPVRASEVGDAYNVVQGTSMYLGSILYAFVSAEAYKSFSGGSDVSNLEETINKIPSGLSIRGFVNKNACEGMLRDSFDDGNYPILACSTVGYGNSAQRRDKHNVFGVGIGGRVDLYVRNFGDVYLVTDIVKGKKNEVRNASGEVVSVSYELYAGPDKFPGSYWIKEISTVSDVNSSLEFSCRRVSDGTDGTWHDFDVSKDSSETFNTVWQGLAITAKEVPPDGEDSSSDEDTWSDDREFKVVAYCLPQATELQEYVDRDDIRSVSTDVVVRCPIMCNVTVSANVIYDTKKPIDVDDAKTKIRKYINGRGFVKTLTRSEIVHILKSCGAISVDLGKKDMLYGTLYDSYGKEYNLSGDSLQINGLADAGAMLTSDTTIFVAEPENIQITLTPNE